MDNKKSIWRNLSVWSFWVLTMVSLLVVGNSIYGLVVFNEGTLVQVPRNLEIYTYTMIALEAASFVLCQLVVHKIERQQRFLRILSISFCFWLVMVLALTVATAADPSNHADYTMYLVLFVILLMLSLIGLCFASVGLAFALYTISKGNKNEPVKKSFSSENF
ncbi:hypothetical protein [Mycoplasma hafezii]|uniref:hypothetical protein n=1 Tax=Mycoplasma hafezii TaxID=525886 RepID=UPI003CF9635D